MEKGKENLNYFCMTDCLTLVNNPKGLSGMMLGWYEFFISELAEISFGLAGICELSFIEGRIILFWIST